MSKTYNDLKFGKEIKMLMVVDTSPHPLNTSETSIKSSKPHLNLHWGNGRLALGTSLVDHRVSAVLSVRLWELTYNSIEI